jgi:hypothetical protein
MRVACGHGENSEGENDERDVAHRALLPERLAVLFMPPV